MARKQHYLTRDERLKLEALRKAEVPVARIAKQLGVCRQTIYNELDRGECEVVRRINGYYKNLKEYSAEKGQMVHEENQKMKGRQLKIGNDRAFADFLERKILNDKFSPAAALTAARRKGYQTSICVTTLYNYIEAGVFLHLTNDGLWEKRKKKKRGYRPVRRIVHPKLPSITDRPEPISQREEYGHWEMDLVVGKSRSHAALLTLTERRCRQEMIFKLPDKKAASVQTVFDRLERSMGKKRFRERFKSITTDNGSEFLEYEDLTRSIYGGQRFTVWYCHSYAAWEKGTNENHNRIIRRWFPKGTNFEKVTKKQIAVVQDWMNSYPRKILNWKTPNEAAS